MSIQHSLKLLKIKQNTEIIGDHDLFHHCEIRPSFRALRLDRKYLSRLSFFTPQRQKFSEDCLSVAIFFGSKTGKQENHQ